MITQVKRKYVLAYSVLLFLLLQSVAALGNIILKDSYSLLEYCLNGYRDWQECVEPGEGGEVYTCKGYYLGANIPQGIIQQTGKITAIYLNISSVYGGYFKITTIESPGNYSLSLYYKNISGSLLLIPFSKIKLINLTDYWIRLTLIGENGNYSLETPFTPIFIPGGCDIGVEELPSGYRVLSTASQAICYIDQDCKAYRTPEPGEVALCKQIPFDLVSLGSPPARRYDFAKICTDICGNGLCEYSIENPETCSSDCCGAYGRGLEGTPYEGICYSSCGASESCNGREPGFYDESLGIVCDFYCKAITDPTEVLDINFLGAQSQTCTPINASATKCNVTYFFGVETPTVSIELNPEMWISSPEAPVFTKTTGIFGEGEGELPFKNPSTYIFTFDFPSVGEFSGLLVLRHKYRTPHSIYAEFHVIYPSEVYLEAPNCIGIEEETSCPQGGAALINLTFSKEMTSKLSAVTPVNYSCLAFGRVIESYTELEPAEVKKVPLIIPIPPEQSPGRYTISCRIFGKNIEEKNVTRTVNLIGKIKDVEISVPPQIIGGKVYTIAISNVKDTAGRRITSYSYFVYLKTASGEVIPLSYNFEHFKVPKEIEEGTAKLCIDVSAPFYDKYTKCVSVPVVRKIPLEVGIFPTKLYFPVKGGQKVFYIALKNTGDEVIYPEISISTPEDITLSIPPEKNVTLLPYSEKKYPIVVEIRPGEPADKEIFVYVLIEGKTLGPMTVHLLRTSQPYPEFHVEPEKLDLYFVLPPAKGNVTICNVGTVEDSYVLLPDEGVKLSRSSLTLPAGECTSIGVTIQEPGSYRLCIKSAKLYREGPRCVDITVREKRVTPEVELLTPQISGPRGSHKPLDILIRTANYSGIYSFYLTSSLVNYSTEFYADANEEKIVEIGIEIQNYGPYLLHVVVIPGRYESKRAEADLWVELTPKIELYVVEKLKDVENLIMKLPEKKAEVYSSKLEKLREELYKGGIKNPSDAVESLEKEIKLEIALTKYGNKAKEAGVYKGGTFIKVLSGILILGGIGAYFYITRFMVI